MRYAFIYKVNDETKVFSIGTPYKNYTCYILDNNLNPLPIGSIGELYIGGAGLARGYLNLPELTKECFLKNPFQTEEEKLTNTNASIYKTGDLVRMLPDGNIEYIGRNDFQIKIRGYRIELAEIEQAILKYPDILQTAVISKLNASTGQLSLLAYYTVKNIADDNLVVRDWEDIYEKEYSANLDLEDYKLNITGWNSSFTDGAIPVEEMAEWVNATNTRIKDISYGRVLEIGCGSGLILFNVIDDCEYYYATDFSKAAISHIDIISKQQGFSDKLETIASPADKLDFDQIRYKYNTTILNSVVQYFPSLEYLEDVILRIIENIQDEGILFIGDIRDYRLLDTFHYAVSMHKYKNISIAEVLRSSRQDNELLISPKYFLHLGRKLKSIVHIDILTKYGRAEHEMNRFRYDVVIHINKKPKTLDKSQNDITFINTTNIGEYLNTHVEDDLFVRYPNKRVYADYIKWNELFSRSKNEVIVEDLLGVDEISALAKSREYYAKIILDIDTPQNLLILFTKTKDKYFSDDFRYSANTDNVYANNPSILSHVQSSNLEQKIYSTLKEELPEYMIPDILVHLERLPLTISGKLDRNALPNPEFIDIAGQYIAPRDELDKSLVQVFAMIF